MSGIQLCTVVFVSIDMDMYPAIYPFKSLELNLNHWKNWTAERSTLLPLY